MLPGAVLAFQHSAPIHHRNMVHAEHLDRAEKCATLYDFCDVDELESLADELEQFQMSATRDHRKVYEILRSQHELKRLMDDHAVSNGNDSDQSSDGIFDDYLHYHW